MLKKSTLREIKGSIERYLAILAIVALGVGFFAGLKVTREAMLATCSSYLEETNFYDYLIATSYGIDDESAEIARSEGYVQSAEGQIEQDVIVSYADATDSEFIYKAMSLPSEINVPKVKEGRLPKASNECVVDSMITGYDLGDKLVITDENSNSTIETFKYREYTIVGKVSSPLYLDYQRGSTDVGDGKLSSYFYIPRDGFKLDYYTALYLKLKGSDAYFGDGANDAIKSHMSDVKKLSSKINSARREVAISEAKSKLEESRREYESGLAEYNSQKSAAYEKLDAAEAGLDEKSRELIEGKEKLNAQKEYLQMMREQAEGDAEQTAQLDAGIGQIDASLTQIRNGESQIASGRAEVAANRASADRKFADARAKLSEAKAELDKANRSIEDMELGSYYSFTRDDNIGFSVFDENASIVDGIAKIFPVFFFFVAALVCMTTMTRMIDEHRTQIGVLKALGYSNAAVLSKYLFYSGSAALIGAIFGFFVGCKVFPVVIWNAYGMMYDFEPKIEFVFNWKLGLITLLVAILCSMGATWVSCASDFEVAPAELIRPKSPSAGKRILLERIPSIWRRISFLYKVSIRNTFRYKKRFFMMVLGVSGCTALLVAAMGINTTIKKVAAFQYEEVINYDYLLVFNEDMDEKEQDGFIKYNEDINDVETKGITFVHEGSAKAEVLGKNVEVTLVASDGKDMGEYVNLHSGRKKLSYPKDGEAIVCLELQRRYGVNVGDTIKIKDGYREAEVKVSGVCDNYVRNYIYINDSTYEKSFGKKPSIRTAYVRLNDDASDDDIWEHAARLRLNDKVAAASVNLDTIEMVDKMMKSLDAVVFVVILCAGLLAFIVLYNLTNINITERIREVATIKVLGFYDSETQSYIFRENYILTGIAAIVGIPLGKLLLDFVISKICVNTIFFVPRITVADYIVALALTFVFAVVVNMAMRRRLRDVSMTESLKSIE